MSADKPERPEQDEAAPMQDEPHPEQEAAENEPPIERGGDRTRQAAGDGDGE
jgi:hypothetical protein